MGSTPGRLCNIVQRIKYAVRTLKLAELHCNTYRLDCAGHSSPSVDAKTCLACCLHVRGLDFNMRSGYALPHFFHLHHQLRRQKGKEGPHTGIRDSAHAYNDDDDKGVAITY